jgi:hypothetical protein
MQRRCSEVVVCRSACRATLAHVAATVGPRSRGLRDMEVLGHCWPQKQKEPAAAGAGRARKEEVDATG